MNTRFFRNLLPTAAILLAAGSASALSPSIPYRVRLPDLAPGAPTRLRFDLCLPEGAATNTLWSGLATVVPAPDGSIGVLLDDTLRTDASAPGLEEVFRRADGAPLLLAVSDAETSVRHGPMQTLLPVPLAHVAGEVRRANAPFAVPGTLTAGNATLSGPGPAPLADGRLTVDGDSTVETLAATRLTIDGSATFMGPVSFQGGVVVQDTVDTEIDGVGAVPVGSILFWTKKELPEPEGAWAWCDGGNGTPDLRGLFLRGASDSLPPGTTGGSETVALSDDHVPSHTHNYSFTAPADENAGFSAKLKSSWKVWRNTETETIDTAPAGNAAPHENMPAFLRLAFIMRIR